MIKPFASRIFFDPTGGPAPGVGAWRHALQRHLDRPYTGGEIAVDATGVPVATVLLVETEDAPDLRTDPDMVFIPDAARVPANVRARLESMGVPPFADDARGPALRQLGRLNNPRYEPSV